MDSQTDVEIAQTNLGTKQLHKQHSILIEGGQFPRSRVMDQTIVDFYLMKGIISLVQHQAAEFLLGQAGRAGIWATGIHWDGTGGGRRNFVPFGMFPYGRTLTTVVERYGQFHAYLVERVVCHNWDVSKNDRRMKILKQALDWIALRRMGIRANPV